MPAQGETPQEWVIAVCQIHFVVINQNRHFWFDFLLLFQKFWLLHLQLDLVLMLLIAFMPLLVACPRLGIGRYDFYFFFPVKFAIFLGVRLLYLDDIFCLRNFVGSFGYPQFYIGYVLLLLVCGFSLMPIFISIGFCYVRYLQWYFKCDNPQVILQYANFFSWFLIYHLKGYFHFCEIGSAFGKFNFHL